VSAEFAIGTEGHFRIAYRPTVVGEFRRRS
jgi:hypothetical protein